MVRRGAVALTGWAALALAISAGLSGCGSGAEVPMPAPSATPSGTTTPVPQAVPILNPEGTALQNLEYFKFVMNELLADKPNSSGKAIVAHLVGSGFAKESIEVTPDQTPHGYDVDSVQFSVLINESCLIGQSDDGKLRAFAGSVLGTGACLIGNARP